MINHSIQFPTIDFKNYIEYIFKYCEEKGFSLILKGSLVKGTKNKHTDIDLIILGPITNDNMDDIISIYDMPVMTNFTENPKGIFILIYKNGICVDLELRETVLQEEIEKYIVLLRNNSNFLICDKIQTFCVVVH